MGFEALLRGPTGRYQSPEAFLDRAEREGVLPKVERFLAERASEIAKKEFGEKKLFFNVTPTSFMEGNFLKGAFDALEPERVILEITESAPITDVKVYEKASSEWHRRGQITLALDDIGSGYSRLWAAGPLRLGYLKVDRRLFHSKKRKWLVPYLIQKARCLGAQVVIEGLESLRDVEEAYAMGADLGQGYYWGYPVEIGAIKIKTA